MEKNLEELLYATDFSGDTDLKERLARRLFEKEAKRSGQGASGAPSRKRTRGAVPLSDDEAEQVSAALGTEPVRKEEQADIPKPPFGPGPKL